MSDLVELKPCPFCGGEAERLRPQDAHGGMVNCRCCGAEAFGPKWNRRADSAEITRLQKELETARESLERLVTTYDGMEDGNGDPCPDVAHAKTVIRALKDEEVAG